VYPRGNAKALQDGFADLFLRTSAPIARNSWPTGRRALSPSADSHRRVGRRDGRSGLKAKITCVDPKVLPKEFAGRDFNSQFLRDLPQPSILGGKWRIPFLMYAGGVPHQSNVEVERLWSEMASFLQI